MHVIEASEKLSVVVAGLSFSKTTAKSDKVEELTSSNKFKDNKVDSLTPFLGVDLLTLAHLDEPDDVGVLQLGKSLDFCLDQLVEGLVVVDNLDCVARASIILGKLDLAGDSTAECSSKSVLVQFCWHIRLLISDRFVFLRINYFQTDGPLF